MPKQKSSGASVPRAPVRLSFLLVPRGNLPEGYAIGELVPTFIFDRLRAQNATIARAIHALRVKPFSFSDRPLFDDPDRVISDDAPSSPRLSIHLHILSSEYLDLFMRAFTGAAPIARSP